MDRCITEGNLVSALEDPDLRAWLAIHRALGTTPSPQISTGCFSREGEDYFLQWEETKKTSLPRALGDVLGLAPGERLALFFYAPSSGNCAGERLLLGVGIPAEAKKSMNIQALDFVPMQPRAFSRDLGGLWDAASRVVDFITPEGDLIPWSDKEWDRADHLSSLVRRLDAQDGLKPLARMLRRFADQEQIRLDGAAPEDTHPLDRVPYLQKGEKKVYLRLEGRSPLALNWLKDRPSPTGADFLGEGDCGDMIRVGGQEVSATWMDIHTLFPVQVLDFHVTSAQSDSARRQALTPIRGRQFEAYVPVVPEAFNWIDESILRTWGGSLKPAQDGQSLELTCDLVAKRTYGGKAEDLPLRFSICYPRLETGDTKSGAVGLAARRAAMTLGYFPRFKSDEEKWDNYFLHVADWKNLEGFQLLAHGVSKVSGYSVIPVSEDGPSIHRMKFRPIYFELRQGKNSLGGFVPSYQELRTAGPTSEVRLAIDLGSANTTLAVDWNEYSNDPALVDMDIRELYAPCPLVDYGSENGVQICLTAGSEAEALLKSRIQASREGGPRYSSFGIPHLRTQRINRPAEVPQAEMAGFQGSPWIKEAFGQSSLKPDLINTDKRYQSMPTQAAKWVPTPETFQAFQELMPILERGVASSPSGLASILGRPTREGAEWRLVQNIKWDVWGGTSGLNLKATYLYEILVLACASISWKARVVVDPDQVKLTVTYPYGQKARLEKSLASELPFKIFQTVSESEANHRYYARKALQKLEENVSAFTLIMDMGGSTTDFSLLHGGELKAYASLGQVDASGRRRFYGGLGLVDLMNSMPADGGFSKRDANGIWAYSALSEAGLTQPSLEAETRREGIAALLNARLPEMQLDSQDMRIKLYLMAYAVCYFGAQLVLHHLAKTATSRTEHIKVSLWLPGSGWKLLRLAEGVRDADWTELKQFQTLQRVFHLAFEEAAKAGGFENLQLEVLNPEIQIPNHRTVAKSSVALGALMPQGGLKDGARSVPFGISFGEADQALSSKSPIYGDWVDGEDSESPVDQPLAAWFRAYEESGADINKDGGHVWASLKHPFQCFGSGAPELPGRLFRLLGDEKLRDRFLARGEKLGESRFQTLLKESHRLAVMELWEEMKKIQNRPDMAKQRSPLGIYLESLNYFVFQQGDSVSSQVGKDAWDLLDA
ncbi:hypothetical protein [Holophaga foetida]|uniref:hypothetical protein n=1 Tax=Holophaga foetida TaxID=35839 RepID=UPI0011DCF2F3|nr:hypothetical protein [Holophaga foetida]